MIWEEVAILLMGPLGMGVISWALDAAMRRWDCPDDMAGTAGESQGVGPPGGHGASAG